MSKNQIAILVAKTVTSAAFSLLLSQSANQNKKPPVIVIPIAISLNAPKSKKDISKLEP